MNGKLRFILAAPAVLLAACGTPANKLVPEFTPGEKQLVLVEYRNTRITIGAFLDTMQRRAGDSATLSLYSIKELRNHFLDNVIKPEVILEEARRRGYDKTPAVRAKETMYRESLMAGHLHRMMVERGYTIPEDELRRYYEAHRNEYVKHPRVEMRHIQVDGRQQADRLLARIHDGERIGDLAGEFSTEDYGRKNWGKSGNFPLGQGKYPAAVERALAAMKPGEVRGPIHTPDGWHIVKLISKEGGKRMPFEKVRIQVNRDMAPAYEQERLHAYVDSLGRVHGLSVDSAALDAAAAPSDIVARIGDRPVFMRDVNGAHRKMYPGVPLTPPARKNALQALLAKELIRAEAYARGLDTLASIRHLTEVRTRNAVVKYFDETEIDARIRITERDLKEYYGNKRQRMRVRLFATTERELAHQVRDALTQGDSFESITTVVKDRARTKYITWDRNEQENRQLVEAAFRLSPTDRISDVLSLPSPDNGVFTHYVLVYDNLTVQPARPWAKVRDEVHRELYGRRRRAGRNDYYERLYERAHVRFHEDNMTLFIRRWIDYLRQGKPE